MPVNADLWDAKSIPDKTGKFQQVCLTCRQFENGGFANFKTNRS